MGTIQQILDEVEQANQALTELEESLQAEMNAIELNAFRAGKSLTDQEIKTIDDRQSQLEKAQNGAAAMALVTLQRLNNAEDLGDLIAQMNAINGEMKETLDDLKQIERYAATAAAVAEGLGNIAGNIVEIAT